MSARVYGLVYRAEKKQGTAVKSYDTRPIQIRETGDPSWILATEDTKKNEVALLEFDDVQGWTPSGAVHATVDVKNSLFGEFELVDKRLSREQISVCVARAAIRASKAVVAIYKKKPTVMPVVQVYPSIMLEADKAAHQTALNEILLTGVTAKTFEELPQTQQLEILEAVRAKVNPKPQVLIPQDVDSDVLITPPANPEKSKKKKKDVKSKQTAEEDAEVMAKEMRQTQFYKSQGFQRHKDDEGSGDEYPQPVQAFAPMRQQMQPQSNARRNSPPRALLDSAVVRGIQIGEEGQKLVFNFTRGGQKYSAKATFLGPGRVKWDQGEVTDYPPPWTGISEVSHEIRAPDQSEPDFIMQAQQKFDVFNPLTYVYYLDNCSVEQLMTSIIQAFQTEGTKAYVATHATRLALDIMRKYLMDHADELEPEHPSTMEQMINLHMSLMIAWADQQGMNTDAIVQQVNKKRTGSTNVVRQAFADNNRGANRGRRRGAYGRGNMGRGPARQRTFTGCYTCGSYEHVARECTMGYNAQSGYNQASQQQAAPYGQHQQQRTYRGQGFRGGRGGRGQFGAN